MSRPVSHPRKGVAPLAVVLAIALLSGGAMAALSMPQQTALQDSSTGSAAISGDALSASSSAASVQGSSDELSAVLGTETLTSQSKDDSRAKNLALAAQALDGTVIEPGETFSLNSTLREGANGATYRVAPESADGLDGAEQGGGVCQVASALFIAAVRADLDVVERHAHEAPCDYVAIGLDAEVDFADRDLKLRNGSDTPVQIHATAEGQTVKVELRGAPPKDGTTFDVVATIVENADAGGAPESRTPPPETVTVETRKLTFEDGVKKSEQILDRVAYRVDASSFVTGSGIVSATK